MGHRDRELGDHAGAERADGGVLRRRAVRARITGGLFQDFAPSPFHMHRVLAPLVRSMGVDLCLDVVRPGYVPGAPASSR